MFNMRDGLLSNPVWKTLLILYVSMNISCGNRVIVPEHITADVNIPATTQTVNVVHTVAVSLEMTSLFTTTCTTNVDKFVPPLPEPDRSNAIKNCVALATQKFIDDLLTLVNGLNTGGSND